MMRAHNLHEGPNLCLRLAGSGIFEGGFERALLWDSEISARPFPGDGIRLGWRICDARIYWRSSVSQLGWEGASVIECVPSSLLRSPS